MTIFMEQNSHSIIIADTSGLVSLFFPGDHNHVVAVKVAKQLQNKQRDILIPTAVFVEFLNVLGRKVGHGAALAAAAELTAPFLIGAESTDLLTSSALKKFEMAPPAVSFTDCLVMAV